MTRAPLARSLAAAVLAVLTVAPGGPHAAGPVLQSRAGEGVLVTRDAFLMGTRAALRVHADDRDQGLATLEAALGALERTEAQLSTWRDDSAISALNRTPAGMSWIAEPAMCRVFTEIYRWRGATRGAFDPAIGQLTRAWDVHGAGRIPGPRELREARAKSGLDALRFDPEACRIHRVRDATIDVGAFGKGEALDRAAEALGPRRWLIDLGGQVSAHAPEGSPAWRVAIAHPADRARAALEIELRNGSLSTSGGSERDTFVQGRRVGHILDPRTGTPAMFTGSVTVWHESGLVADILSTALYVMGPGAGREWAAAHGIGAAYLVVDGSAVRLATTAVFDRRVKAVTAPE